jgi:transposase-like protein
MANCMHLKRVKNGMARGKQRYKCRECGLSFTEHLLHDQYPDSFRHLARFLRAENVSIRYIGEIVDVSEETLRRWTNDVPRSSGTMRHEYLGDLHKEEKEERRTVSEARIFFRFEAFNVTIRPNRSA